jgi:hypothetical protein
MRRWRLWWRLVRNQGIGRSYDLRVSPWQVACWHWHVSSVIPFASAHAEQQYFSPFAGVQLQAGRAHLVTVFMMLSCF